MILIADCGSTKADWLLTNGSAEIQRFSTTGFNPYFHSTDFIQKSLQKELFPRLSSVPTQIFFYGAGCADEQRCKVIRDALDTVFPDTCKAVTHDLMAAARAVCGKAPGIVCILGTGSNSCAYDGELIVDKITSLGYMLGDEGSGMHLGKTLIRAYCYREMDSDFVPIFESVFGNNHRKIINEVYGSERPNAHLAAYAKILVEHKTHPFVQQIVRNCFQAFIDKQISKYNNYHQHPVSFVGSIAFHFSDLLKDVLLNNQLTFGKIIQKPINALLDFHHQNHQSHTSTKR